MYSAHHTHCESCDLGSLWHLTAVQFVSPQCTHSVSKFKAHFVLDTLAHPLGYDLFTPTDHIFTNCEAIYCSNTLIFHTLSGLRAVYKNLRKSLSGIWRPGSEFEPRVSRVFFRIFFF